MTAKRSGRGKGEREIRIKDVDKNREKKHVFHILRVFK